MARQLSNTDPAVEEQEGEWDWVPDGVCSDSISPTQKNASIVDGGLACKPLHPRCCPHAIDVGLHGVNATDANPTTDQRVESPDSTATGMTFSAPGDVSSDPQPPTPTEDSQPQPLTRANLGPNNMPGLINDIQAWINGDLTWLRFAVDDDKASVVPLERVTTWHSSDGSLDFVFTPAQPSSFGRDAQSIGAVFEHLPQVTTYSQDLELDEA
ncbi:hypothetical protein diail_5158 [Diaporthe ilicicola]|nr:hypothetical protein diail_5158 [Diaporthe ilicicola]